MANILRGARLEDIARAVEIALEPNWTPPAEYLAENVSSTVVKIALDYPACDNMGTLERGDLTPRSESGDQSPQAN